ncbi:MAG TPA: hypothetical protein VLI41_07670 [Phenylobacterium sp.]|uniref:hypothetical protein n=1 Tax=Phenylobacterium sp. TaxID=1871053 RepID=UPI002BA5CB95|nr:hypothetical protein [Phenylobacterium sp.]HSV03071.1 hypothetical protein [Phenylobacterium sp.]
MAQDRKPQDRPQGAPERYPSVRQDDAVERTGRGEEVAGEGRTFDPAADAPTPKGPESKPDGKVPPATSQGRLGPEGDPAEGKRR